MAAVGGDTSSRVSVVYVDCTPGAQLRERSQDEIPFGRTIKRTSLVPPPLRLFTPPPSASLTTTRHRIRPSAHYPTGTPTPPLPSHARLRPHRLLEFGVLVRVFPSLSGHGDTLSGCADPLNTSDSLRRVLIAPLAAYSPFSDSAQSSTLHIRPIQGTHRLPVPFVAPSQYPIPLTLPTLVIPLTIDSSPPPFDLLFSDFSSLSSDNPLLQLSTTFRRSPRGRDAGGWLRWS
jgi:hypothetical protein